MAEPHITPPRLTLRGITKIYPGCVANDSIDLNIEPAEIHALLGENGAGKSTLMKVIYGLVRPDQGEVLWDGLPIDIKDPAHARKLGIDFEDLQEFGFDVYNNNCGGSGCM